MSEETLWMMMSGSDFQIVEREFQSFDWNETKRIINLEKHRIDFPQAADALSSIHIEARSDKNEEVRILAVCDASDRIIAVIYTVRNDVCWIISARPAHKKERRQYHELLTD